MAFLFVALGGAIGAMARYAISLIPVKTGFPVLTLITNILGAILIGFIVGIASSHENIPENAILFLKNRRVQRIYHIGRSRLLCSGLGYEKLRSVRM